MQLFQCAQTWHAVLGRQTRWVEGVDWPNIPDGKAEWYHDREYTTSNNRTVKMRREAQATLYKKAFGYAGYSANGQVTHRPRHDGAVTGRLQLDASTQSLGDMGDWQQTVLTGVYARLPGGTDLAKFAGFGSRAHYMVVEGLLDPSLMPEFKGMVQALCEDLPELLEEHKEARHGCCTYVGLYIKQHCIHA